MGWVSKVWPPKWTGLETEISRPERTLIEPVIGHLKAEHRMGRNYLAHRAGDAGGNYKTRKERRFTLTFSIRNLANKI